MTYKPPFSCRRLLCESFVFYIRSLMCQEKETGLVQENRDEDEASKDRRRKMKWKVKLYTIKIINHPHTIVGSRRRRRRRPLKLFNYRNPQQHWLITVRCCCLLWPTTFARKDFNNKLNNKHCEIRNFNFIITRRNKWWPVVYLFAKRDETRHLRQRWDHYPPGNRECKPGRYLMLLLLLPPLVIIP